MKQNLTLALLSVIATLLVVILIQNLHQPPILLSQMGGGGTSTVGPIGVATGPVSGAGDAAAFWLYDPAQKRLLVYFLNNKNQLEFRAGRSLEFDLRAVDWAMKPGLPPPVRKMQEILREGGEDGGGKGK